jgi:Hemolysins and related proteins containing CBS domains
MKNELKNSLRWALPLAVITLVLAAIFSIISTAVLNHAGVLSGIFVVLVIILIALFFDIIGVAATASNEAPFHSMASKGMHGARYAVWLTKNADRVNTFCTDVIGDISAIISGTAASVVVAEMIAMMASNRGSFIENVLSVVVTCFVAATTVFVKALGKTFAIKNATKIIYKVGYVIFFTEHHLHLPVLNLLDKKTSTDKKRKKGE